MSDYTLPEMPTEDGEARTAFGVRPVYLRQTMLTYGHVCAEHVRAPLAEENARLQSKIAELSADLTALVMNGEGGRLPLAQENRKLLARVAELEAEASAQIERADRHENRHKDLSVENIRLRAELEAKGEG